MPCPLPTEPRMLTAGAVTDLGKNFQLLSLFCSVFQDWVSLSSLCRPDHLCLLIAGLKGSSSHTRSIIHQCGRWGGGVYICVCCVGLCVCRSKVDFQHLLLHLSTFSLTEPGPCCLGKITVHATMFSFYSFQTQHRLYLLSHFPCCECEYECVRVYVYGG